MSDDDHAAELAAERNAVEEVGRLLGELAPHLPYVWHWGDGCGGYVLEQLADVVRGIGHKWPFDIEVSERRYEKAVIPRRLSKQVFERDEYRCVTCGTHIDLTCDHIIPESKGGPTTFENLQTMCRPCNSSKGNRA